MATNPYTGYDYSQYPQQPNQNYPAYGTYGQSYSQQPNYTQPSQPNYQQPPTQPTPSPYQPPAQQSQSSWDTNGYATPGYTPTSYGNVMPGWDSTKWSNQNLQDPKYVVGRILSNYPQNTGGFASAMQQIQQAYPGAKQTGEDTLYIPGVGNIDVVKAGGGFWWGPETDANGNPYPKAGVSTPQSTITGAAGGVTPAVSVGSNIAASNPSYAASGPNSGIASQEQSLLSQYLSNPYSLSPEVIAQMKGVEHDQNALATKQLQEQIAQAFASRGTYGGGAELAGQRRAGEDAYSSLLGAYRQTDIDAAKQRTQDIMNALGVANTYMGREEDLATQLKQLALQRELGLGDLGVRNRQITEQGRQFNAGLGFDYTQLGMGQDQAILRALGLG